MSKKEIVVDENTETEVLEKYNATEKRNKEKSKSRESEKTVTSVMYIGPNITNVVQKSTVFKNGVYPETLKKAISEHPYIEKLLIPIGLLPEAKMELARADSALSVIYNKVKNNT